MRLCLRCFALGCFLHLSSKRFCAPKRSMISCISRKKIHAVATKANVSRNSRRLTITLRNRGLPQILPPRSGRMVFLLHLPRKKPQKTDFFGTLSPRHSFCRCTGAMPMQLVEKGEFECENIGGRGIDDCTGHRGARGISASRLLHAMPKKSHVYFLSNLGSGRAAIIHSSNCPGRAGRCDPKPAPSAGSRGERRSGDDRLISQAGDGLRDVREDRPAFRMTTISNAKWE